MPGTSPMPLTGGKRHGATVKTLKRVLKKAGLKTTGRKAALTRRAKKAHLMVGGTPSLTKAAEKAAETAKSAVETATEVVKTPLQAAKSALGGRRRR